MGSSPPCTIVTPPPASRRIGQIWEPETRANTSVTLNLHTHKLSPYTETPLYGKVLATIVGGELTALYGNLNRKPCGKVVLGRDA